MSIPEAVSKKRAMPINHENPHTFESDGSIAGHDHVLEKVESTILKFHLYPLKRLETEKLLMIRSALDPKTEKIAPAVHVQYQEDEG
jgi:hypothetical protein